MHETRNRKVPHTLETTRWTLVHLAKARANKAKASTARAKAKGSKDSKDSPERTRTTTRIRLNVGTVESADTTRKNVGAEKNTRNGGSKGKQKPKNADAHNLDQHVLP